MKHTPRFALACAVAALAACPSLAFSALIMSDTFTYPDGNLVGQGGWAIHSGLATDKPIQVTSGVVRVNQSAGSGQDINRPHTGFAASSTSYRERTREARRVAQERRTRLRKAVARTAARAPLHR